MKKVVYLFFSCLLLFLINQGLVLFEVQRPEFMSSYLNDLLVMPIILTVCLFATRFIHSDHSIRLSLFSAFSLAALYSLYFEGYLPGKSARYTADGLDVALYFLGALIFYVFQNFGFGKKREKRALTGSK